MTIVKYATFTKQNKKEKSMETKIRELRILTFGTTKLIITKNQNNNNALKS